MAYGSAPVRQRTPGGRGPWRLLHAARASALRGSMGDSLFRATAC